jgi:hypothetical protein
MDKLELTDRWQGKLYVEASCCELACCEGRSPMVTLSVYDPDDGMGASFLLTADQIDTIHEWTSEFRKKHNR